MRVAVVAEYYPRAARPALGIWAHRQALAAAEAGADVHVLVLHRPVPPRAALRARDRRGADRAAAPAAAGGARRPPRDLRPVPRAAAPAQLRHAGALGGAVARARAAAPAPPLPVRPRPRALRRAGRRRRPPRAAGAAARRLGPRRRPARRRPALAPPARARCAARSAAPPLVLANSAGMERARARRSARERTRVVHLGADLPAAPRRAAPARLVTVGHLSRASATPTCCARCGCCATRTRVEWVVVGDGPGARARWSGSRASSAWPTASRFTGALRARRRRSGGSARSGVRAAERRRGVRRRLRRGDGRRRARDRLPRRGRAGGDRRGRAGACGWSRRPTRRRSRASSTRCSPARAARGARRRGPRDGRRATSRGRRAGAPRWRPTSRRWRRDRVTVTVALPVLNGGALLGEVLAAVRAQEVDRRGRAAGDRLGLHGRLARARPQRTARA